MRQFAPVWLLALSPSSGNPIPQLVADARRLLSCSDPSDVMESHTLVRPACRGRNRQEER